MREIQVNEVAADPIGTARQVMETWAMQFDLILIHLDADVLDFVDFQLAENCRRNIGLKLQRTHERPGRTFEDSQLDCIDYYRNQP